MGVTPEKGMGVGMGMGMGINTVQERGGKGPGCPRRGTGTAVAAAFRALRHRSSIGQSTMILRESHAYRP